MDSKELQTWVISNKQLLLNYKKYLENMYEELVPSILNNVRDKDMDMVNKGKIQLLAQLINQLS